MSINLLNRRGLHLPRLLLSVTLYCFVITSLPSRAEQVPSIPAPATTPSSGSWGVGDYGIPLSDLPGGGYPTAQAACDAISSNPIYGGTLILIFVAADPNIPSGQCRQYRYFGGWDVYGAPAYHQLCPAGYGARNNNVVSTTPITCTKIDAPNHCPPVAADETPFTLDPGELTCSRPDKLTISLISLGGNMKPTETRAAYALVTSGGSPKSGARVNLSLTVAPDDDGQPYAAHVGTVSPNSGTTGADGRLNFVFTAPVAGGTHTIAATCDDCTNNPVTGTIKVSGCPVGELASLADLSVLMGETPEQSLLTQQLEGGMNGYSLLSPATQTAEQCLASRVNTVVGQPSISGYKVTSTIRTYAYQKHLRDVWDKFWKLKGEVDKDSSIQQRCQTLITKVEGQMGFNLNQDPTDEDDSCNPGLGRAHCVRYPPASADPKHVAKTAFDIPPSTVRKFELILWLNQMIDSTVQKEANTCGLNWGGTFSPRDTMHFLLR